VSKKDPHDTSFKDVLVSKRCPGPRAPLQPLRPQKPQNRPMTRSFAQGLLHILAFRDPPGPWRPGESILSKSSGMLMVMVFSHGCLLYWILIQEVWKSMGKAISGI